jgi:probable addiction module antidote protein
MTMTKKTRPYRELRAERLANPEVAAAYLNATRKNSPDNFLEALKNVAQARKMAAVAKDAGVQRETLYRSLSEQGNPTWDTLSAVLAAVGVNVVFEPLSDNSFFESPIPPSAPNVILETSSKDKPANPLASDKQTWSGLNPLWGGGSDNNFALQGIKI